MWFLKCHFCSNLATLDNDNTSFVCALILVVMGSTPARLNPVVNCHLKGYFKMSLNSGKYDSLSTFGALCHYYGSTKTYGRKPLLTSLAFMLWYTNAEMMPNLLLHDGCDIRQTAKDFATI